MREHHGFTLIELLVVMTVLALLLSIAAPRYFRHVEMARETVLRENLHILRTSIDKFRGDRGRYPANLQELVTERSLRDVPLDPFTDRSDTWVTVPPNHTEPSVYDVKSGATGNASNGRPYAAL
jgi:general secretion pathway protein G